MLVLAIWSETLLLKPSARQELLPREEDLIKTVSGQAGDVVAEYNIEALKHIIIAMAMQCISQPMFTQ